MIFPNYNVKYIAIYDNVNTETGSGCEQMAFTNLCNDVYARQTSVKIKASKKLKGESGKPLGEPVYGYKKSELDKDQWVIDDVSAKIVRRIFDLCLAGRGPFQIARILTSEKVLIPAAYAEANGRYSKSGFSNPTRWSSGTVVRILENAEYTGCIVNFKTHVKSRRNKKSVSNPKSEWKIFENKHETIIDKDDFDKVQKIRNGRIRQQKCTEISPFANIAFCADCGARLALCRAKSLSKTQEHLKCGTYSKNSSACTAHYIRTEVLEKIVLSEINKVLETVKKNEKRFAEAAMEKSKSAQSLELKKSRKALEQAEKRISELDNLFARIYEDNVSGKLSDERFSSLSERYDVEQKELRETALELKRSISDANEKADDITKFIQIARRHTTVTELTSEIMHDFIDKIVVHAPDNSSGHRKQQIDIYFRFNIAFSTAVADRHDYDSKVTKEKLCS